MKLIAEIDGKSLPLNIRREGARVLAEIDGHAYDLEARKAGKDAYLLLLSGHVYECVISSVGGAETAHDTARVDVRGSTFNISLFDPRRLRGARAAGEHEAGRAQICAPMHGKVVRILVQQGQAVAAGDGLIVVEAMKMQNELKSPRAGAVIELHATAGATVNAGEVLVVVE